jgi:anti-sigma regulatory factor (Ser/Thr protein kinase)
MTETSGSRWTLMLAQELGTGRTARTAVRRWLRGVTPQSREDAVLVVDELVTNAVRYGRPPIRLSVEVSDDAIHIQVADAGPDRPRRQRPTTDGGWGLNIVDRLTGTVEFAEGATDVRCRVPA